MALDSDIVVTDEHDICAQRAALFAAIAAETVDRAGTFGRLVGDADFDAAAVAFSLERHLCFVLADEEYRIVGIVSINVLCRLESQRKVNGGASDLGITGRRVSSC